MNIIRKIKPFELTPSQVFHEQTKIKLAKKQLSYNEWPESWKKVYFKGYPRFEAIKLSTPKINDDILLKDTLTKRNSKRDFSGQPIKDKDLSNLLYFSAGIKEKTKDFIANRFYPSAGARYPLEIYPIIFNVKGINPGIYHYYVKSHLLETLPKKQDFKPLALGYFGNQPWVNKSNLLLIFSAVFYRNKVKYGERGYRHVLTELGCIFQNIYLLGAALNIKCCPTGGYNDDGYNKLLDLDGIEESVIGVVAVGK